MLTFITTLFTTKTLNRKQLKIKLWQTWGVYKRCKSYILQRFSFSPLVWETHGSIIREKIAGACFNPSWSLQALHVLLIGFIKRIPVLSTSLSLPAACSSSGPITSTIRSQELSERGHIRTAAPSYFQTERLKWCRVSSDATCVENKEHIV